MLIAALLVALYALEVHNTSPSLRSSTTVRPSSNHAIGHPEAGWEGTVKHVRRVSLLSVAILAALASRFGVGGTAEVEGQARLLAPARVIGVATAIVVDTHDPEGRGRIKVQFPWLRKGEEEGVWARVSVPLGGAVNGFFVLPEVDDEVLVAFEHGDVDRPFVIGSVWNGVNPPPAPGQ